MAAKKKAAKKSAKNNLPKLEKPEFGVGAVAKILGVEEATVRVKLRSHKDIKKTGRTYDFGSKAGAEKIAARLKKAA